VTSRIRICIRISDEQDPDPNQRRGSATLPSGFPEEALPLADEVLKVPQEIVGRRRRSWEAPAPASHCTASATPSGSAYTQISNNKTCQSEKTDTGPDEYEPLCPYIFGALQLTQQEARKFIKY
jgi:hypothetical protein